MIEKSSIRELVSDKLLGNSLETAEAYAMYEHDESIRTLFPSRETYNRFVRKVKGRLILEAPKEKQPGKATFTEDEMGAIIEIFDSDRIKTLEQLLSECEVDPSVWKVDSYTVNKWESTSREKGVIPLFQIKARLVRIAPSIPVIQPLIFPVVPRVNPQATYRSGPKRYLIFADAQIGFNRKGDEWESYHSREAMDIILKILIDHTFDEIIIDGDMLDMTEASRYAQKPEFAGTLQPAINELGLFLYQVRKLAPDSKIVFLAGNHEARLQNNLIENFKFAYNLKAYGEELPLLSLRNILQMDKLGIECIEDYPKGTYWIGDKLRIVHGEFTSVAKELSTGNTSTIMGHLHHVESQSRTVFYKEGPQQITVHTIGCLCKIDGTVPGVTSRPSWQQGFAVVEKFEDTMNVNHIQIYNGKCMYTGKIYEGVDMKPGKLLV